jgi:hypothetical protein
LDPFSANESLRILSYGGVTSYGMNIAKMMYSALPGELESATNAITKIPDEVDGTLLHILSHNADTTLFKYFISKGLD